MRRGAVVCLLAWLALAAACAGRPALSGPGLARVALAVSAEPLPLNPQDEARRRVGALTFRGGLGLSSRDARFGGWSGLLVSNDGGQMLAASDRGWWLSARLEYGPAGDLVGLNRARLGRLRDLAGRPLQGKGRSDAEELDRWDGGVLVSFERDHRLWLYPGPCSLGGLPRPVGLPPWLRKSAANQGVEAVASLADGRLLLLAEGDQDQPYTLGAVGDGRRWQPLRYRLRDGFRPTAAATLPGGDVLVLERRYTVGSGVAARLRRLPAGRIAPGALLRPPLLAELAPPLTVDNFEGLAASRSPGGRVRLYLLSDDNYSAMQQTLLMMFELEDP